MAATKFRMLLGSICSRSMQTMSLCIQNSRNATRNPSGSYLPEPDSMPLGKTGVMITVLPGIMIGAYISQKLASFLEENELFVPSDDDDDDD